MTPRLRYINPLVNLTIFIGIFVTFLFLITRDDVIKIKFDVL